MQGLTTILNKTAREASLSDSWVEILRKWGNLSCGFFRRVFHTAGRVSTRVLRWERGMLQEKQRNQCGWSAVSGTWPNEKGSQDQIRFQPARIRWLWLFMGTIWGTISRFWGEEWLRPDVAKGWLWLLYGEWTAGGKHGLLEPGAPGRWAPWEGSNLLSRDITKSKLFGLGS